MSLRFLPLTILLTFFACCFLLSTSQSLSVIQTFAGSSGDGFLSTQTSLNYPYDISDFVGGELLIADVYNHRIRKVLANGTMTTVCGIGYGGFNGDSQLATSAQLNYPYDAEIFNNEIYIADAYNHRIRKILSNGTIISVAGNGAGGFNGDGQLATNAKLNFPYGVVVNDVGEIFIADTYNHRVRMVLTNGTITTIAGTGTSGFNGDDQLATSAKLKNPTSLDVDSEGNIYISDSGNHRIRKVFKSNGTIVTVAGNGTSGYNGDNIPASEAQLNSPNGVTLDVSNGDIYIADVYNQRVRKVSSKSGLISTLAGNGQQGYNGDNLLPTDASLNLPSDIRLAANGDYLISDTNNHRIRKISSGKITTVAGNGYERFNGDGLLAINSILNHPSSVHVHSDNTIYFADRTNHRIRKISSSGIVSTIIGTGVGGFNGDGLATLTTIQYPHGLVVDSNGILFISDTYNHRIRKLLSNGTLITIAGTGESGYNGDGLALETKLNYPFGMTLADNGSIIFADRSNHIVRKLFSNGTIATIAGTSSSGAGADNILATQSALNTPMGVFVTAQGEVLIADRNNCKIRMVSNNGVITTIAGTGSSGFSGDGLAAVSSKLYYPNDVTVYSNEIYISDTYNQRIRKITTNGTLVTIVGNGQSGDSSEGVLATVSKLYYPYDVAFDSNGRMLIADSSNHKIKIVTFTSSPQVSASVVRQTSNRVINTTEVSISTSNAINWKLAIISILLLICLW